MGPIILKTPSQLLRVLVSTKTLSKLIKLTKNIQNPYCRTKNTAKPRDNNKNTLLRDLGLAICHRKWLHHIPEQTLKIEKAGRSTVVEYINFVFSYHLVFTRRTLAIPPHLKASSAS